jgi:hypothetical protein
MCDYSSQPAEYRLTHAQARSDALPSMTARMLEHLAAEPDRRQIVFDASGTAFLAGAVSDFFMCVLIVTKLMRLPGLSSCEFPSWLKLVLTALVAERWGSAQLHLCYDMSSGGASQGTV